MPTFPVSTGTLITDPAYNELADTIIEIMSVGEDGYGLYDFFTTPITSSMPIRARSWDFLIRDMVNTVYHHVGNISTVTTGSTTTSIVPGMSYQELLPMSTATNNTIIGPDLHNRLKEIADYVLANRYTCAEEQYFRDSATGFSINTDNGVSTRTSEWGVDRSYIDHKVRVRWANRLVARYFFNSGSYITWTPYHSNNGQNDIDSEWASFINSIQNAQAVNEIRYDRAAFLAQTPGTTATVYPVGSTRSFPDPTYQQGSLSCNVEIFKANNEASIEVTATFRNDDSSLIIVTPTVGYWNFTA